MRFKVVYHIGGQIDPESKLPSGQVIVSPESLILSGESSLSIPFTSMAAVELLRPHPRLPVMVRVLTESGPLFLAVLFFRLSRFVCIGDQGGTIQLYDVLRAQIHQAVSA